MELILILLPVSFIAGFTLGVWAHVVSERVEAEAKARRIQALISQRMEQVKKRMETIHKQDLPKSASEERAWKESYSPELRRILGMDSHEES